MADWAGASRTNYFRVKNAAAFVAAMLQHEVKIACKGLAGYITKDSELPEDASFALFSNTEDGSWPSRMCVPFRVAEVVAEVVGAPEAQGREWSATTPEAARALVEQAASAHFKHGVPATEDELALAARLLLSEQYREEEEMEIDFPSEVAAHLADDDVAILQTIGAEKMRYVNGFATAIRSNGETIDLCLSSITRLAEEKWGIKPTDPVY